MSHTPGPWKWTEYNNELTSPSGPILKSTDYEGMWLHPDNEEANARLIARAPEMRDLLKDIREKMYEVMPAGLAERIATILEITE